MTDREAPLVLVADDEEDIRSLVSVRLKRAGYDVITAADGEEALLLVAARLPDLVVSHQATLLPNGQIHCRAITRTRPRQGAQHRVGCSGRRAYGASATRRPSLHTDPEERRIFRITNR